MNGIDVRPGPVGPLRTPLTPRGDRSFRPDIQGLRSVAVILVVLYHCAVPVVGGGYVGVDVFFVISGFLITRQLVSERQRTGRISAAGFYARRIRRLLPSALTVVVVTEVAYRWWGPPLQSTTVAQDGIFSTFYAMNFRLAAQQVDYQHAGSAVSPFQHFWSLAVEEQFYIFWPIVIIATGLLFRRRFGSALGLVAAAALLGSLALSITVTSTDPAGSYFAIQTRAWELGVGALIAVLTPALLRVVPHRTAAVAGWAGLALIVGSAVMFTAQTPFPGSAAAVPVAGAGLVVVSGLASGNAAGVERLLGAPVCQFVGRVSYAWYLWHWPVLMLVPQLLHLQSQWWQNVAFSVCSLGLAVASNVLIEERVARTGTGTVRWLATGAALSAVAAAVAVTVIVLPPTGLDGGTTAAALRLDGRSAPELAALLADAYSNPSVPANLVPALANAVDDVPVTTADGCHADFLVTTEAPCVYGDQHGARTVVLFGDSHAQQWFGALDELAKSQHWRLISWTKAACPLADLLLMSDQLHRAYYECPAWRQDTERRIADLHPDLVIASASDGLPPTTYPNADWTAKTVQYLSTLQRSARQVVYLADIPRPTTNVPVCLAGHLRSAGACEFSRESQTVGAGPTNQLPARHQAVVAAVRKAGVPVVDPTDWFCAPSGCPVVVADTLVYRDATHVTQAYSRALAPVMGAALAGNVDWMRHP